jgi:hypothetical protein
MSRNRWIVLLVASSVLSLGAQPRVEGVQAFAERTEAYAELHRQLEKSIAPQDSFIDAAAMLAASDSLRASLRAARAGAREGDLFAPVAAILRQRVRLALRERGIEARELVAEMIEDTEGTPPPARINEPFSWLHGNIMLPWLLEALPPIPGELEYRLVATHLVLIDVHANLVVDILRDVLPGTTTR